FGDKEIASKAEGGRWALETLAGDYKDIVKNALLNYEIDDPDIKFGNKELVDFAGTMMRKIDWELKKI
ncbi:MAG: DUF4111 domain-containing protein, partial [Anaerolineae bacterium]|nr:DUF4111 domain-containing protein [Anaerolineae bacterium]